MNVRAVLGADVSPVDRPERVVKDVTISNDSLGLPQDEGASEPATGDHSVQRSDRQSGPSRREFPTGRAPASEPRLTPLEALDSLKSGARRIVADPSGLSPAEALFGPDRYAELDVSFDAASATVWSFMKPQRRPSFTMGLLGDLARMQSALKRFVDDRNEPDVKFYVLASRMAETFNLGGDLSHFAGRIRGRDRAALEAYARACIEVLHTNAVGFDRPVVTIALVEGDALGGGFEAALSCDVIIAERNAKFGLPEILFNLFPGMGAYSFLSRRIGPVEAERMIFSGRLYSAGELHAMGLVQIVAEPGEARRALDTYLARNLSRHNAHQAIYRAGRCVNPITFAELERVIDVWVDAALNLREADLRKMERLVSAQNRRLRGQGVVLAAE